MNSCNYKHTYRVEIFPKRLENSYEGILHQEKYDLIREWLGHYLVKGQDWSFSTHSMVFQTAQNKVIWLPIDVWFNKDADAVIFRLKFGL